MEAGTTAAPSNGSSSITQLTELKFEKVVNVEKRGEDGKMYSGDFTFKRLTIGEIAKVGAETARLNGGLPVDNTTDLINTMLAHFKFGIKDAPKWWDPANLYDLGLLKEVFDAQMAFEGTFRPAASGQGSPAPSAG